MEESARAADERRRRAAVAGAPLTPRNARNLVLMAAGAAWPPNALVIARNAAALLRDEPWAGYVQREGLSTDVLVDRALAWICHSQDTVGSGGVGDYQFGRWTPGYPEVTGYIIPTFWDYSRALYRDELARRAIRMADWELRIQKPEGGFESLYEGEGQPAVVFNTGQVIRGLLRTWQETGEQPYHDAAVRAGDWIVANQEADGSWTKANYLGMKRVYDVYAAAALAGLFRATSNEAYARAALANAEFAVGNQLPNGWFDLCDNTPAGNEAPTTHTLCYTAAGLLEIGEALGEDGIASAGRLTAGALADLVEPSGRLLGRFDRDWRPRSRYVVVTGSAQLGAILMLLHIRSGDEGLRRVSLRLLDFLAYVQGLNSLGSHRTGALPGSFPIWGRYVPLKYPAWATKFLLDHLLLVREAAVAPAWSERAH